MKKVSIMKAHVVVDSIIFTYTFVLSSRIFNENSGIKGVIVCLILTFLYGCFYLWNKFKIIKKPSRWLKWIDYTTITLFPFFFIFSNNNIVFFSLINIYIVARVTMLRDDNVYNRVVWRKWEQTHKMFSKIPNLLLIAIGSLILGGIVSLTPKSFEYNPIFMVGILIIYYFLVFVCIFPKWSKYIIKS